MLQSLQVYNLRNIQRLDLDNLLKHNLIIGDNGAGKTSILEAIHILASGKSFRTNQVSQVINKEQGQLIVSGILAPDIRVGVSRNRRSEYQVKINDKLENKLSSLAAHMPVRHLAPDSFLMLTAGSKQRRQFLDFSVFHVKHRFADYWKTYQRQLKQRNALLKHANSYKDMEPWDKQMLGTIGDINAMRTAVFSELKDYLEANQLTFLPQYKVQYSLRTGVGAEDLQNQYERSFSMDKRYGHSTLGPHKADIDIRIDGQDAYTVISRGEMKMLVISMVLAQIDWLVNIKKYCCLLIDDLTSELDIKRQAQLLDCVLTKPGLQTFISSISEPAYFQDHNEQEVAMFHVKHGQIA